MHEAEVIPLNPEGDTNLQRQCEREVLRLLLNYPAQPINAGATTVAQYLLDQTDETPFRIPEYANLLKWCSDEVEAGRFPDARALYQLESTALRRTLSDLVTELDQLSPDWITHQIYVPRELEQLQTACENAILRLNKCTVERELVECLAVMKTIGPEDADAYLAQMAIFKSLKQLDMQLAGLLGTIIAPHIPKLPRLPEMRVERESALPEYVKAETPELLQDAIDKYEQLLPPFRQTRPRGHQALRALLNDPAERRNVIAQAEALIAHGNEVYTLFCRATVQMTKWRKAYDRADEALRAQLYKQDAARLTSERLRGVQLLYEEAENDLKMIRAFDPSAFNIGQ